MELKVQRLRARAEGEEMSELDPPPPRRGGDLAGADLARRDAALSP